VRSTAIGPSSADAANHQAENEWQPGIKVEIYHPHHPQHALARHELAVLLLWGQARASQ
jgi:hypothetical protein